MKNVRWWLLGAVVSVGTSFLMMKVAQPDPRGLYVRVVAKVEQSVVVIGVPPAIRTRHPEIPFPVRGSGVLISKSGFILTCAHVMGFGTEKMLPVKIYDLDAQKFIEAKAYLVRCDPSKDLALLKVSEKSMPAHVLVAKIMTSEDVVAGEEVVVIGHPLGLVWTVSHGIVSCPARFESLLTPSTTLQVDAAINPGNSGGPIFNMRGEVIGIASMLINPEGLRSFCGLGLGVTIMDIHRFLAGLAIS